MRSLLVALLVASALFAGCADSDGPGSETPDGLDSPVLQGRPVVVHRSGGIVVPAAEFLGELPAFTQLNVTTRISGEPTIAISRTGAVFYPAIDFDVGAGATTLPSTKYFRSVDGGATWEDFSPNLANAVDTHPTSFDPYVYSDPTTGRVFALDMGPHVACNKVSWSDDDGRTWLTRDGACPTPVADHPSIFVAPANAMTEVLAPNNPLSPYPHTIFLCSNQIADVQCSMSPDGGFTWLPSQPVFTGVDSQELSERPMDVNWLCGALTGHGHASFVDGTIYIGRSYCGRIMAGISRDGGLNWERVIIADGPEYAPRGEHDVSIATDLDGTAYALWTGLNGTTVWLSSSLDKGASWSTPLNVTMPGVTAVKLPSLVAGASGRIAWQYVGTTTPSGWAVGASDDSGEPKHPEELLNATWNAYVGMSLDAAAEDPVFATTTINTLDQPVKRGTCDGRCFGDVGGMYDFLDIDFDPLTGRLWTAIVDVCTADCDEPWADADTFERSFGAVGKQVGGTFLLDEPYLTP
ncbi:MAG: sialidase family protein [Thermoplasmatota archaeon]